MYKVFMLELLDLIARGEKENLDYIKSIFNKIDNGVVDYLFKKYPNDFHQEEYIKIKSWVPNHTYDDYSLKNNDGLMLIFRSMFNSSEVRVNG